MEHDKNFAIPPFINTLISTINFMLSRYKFCKNYHTARPSDSGVPKRDLIASELAPSGCPTKKTSLQILKYSHWPKREFCQPQYAEFNL